MAKMSLVLLRTVALIFLVSVLGSLHAFFSERKIRRFRRAQRDAARLQRRVGLDDPRGRR